MSFSDNERQIIVRREMEKAIYNCFFEADEKKLRPFIEPTKQLIEKINKHIDK